MNSKVEKILSKFNFDKVRKAMVALEWTYWDTGSIPTVFRLEQAGRNLLLRLIETSDVSEVASGGFVATRDSEGTLKLAFVVEETC